MSIIGPNTRKPSRAPEQKVPDKLWAMTASDEEQSERRKESRIAAKTALRMFSFPQLFKVSIFVIWNTVEMEMPMSRYFATL